MPSCRTQFSLEGRFKNRMLSTQSRHYWRGELLRRCRLNHDLCAFARVHGLHSAPELLKTGVPDQTLERRFMGDVRHGKPRAIVQCAHINPVEPAAVDGAGECIEGSLLLAADCIKLCGEDVVRS